MPASTLYAQRTVGAVAQSTMGASGTASIGSRARGYPARGRANTVAGGDFTVATITVTPSSATLGTTLGTVVLTAVCTIASGDTVADIPTWASDAGTKATVSSPGITATVTGVATGSANITATVGATNSAAVAITVP
jgi:uncharacterized protein YjdB